MYAVIATGGSVIYGKEAMEHLRSIGVVVYIRLPFDLIRKRLGNLHKRGVSIRKDQTLRGLYEERTPLYEKYADLTVDSEKRNISDLALYIKEQAEKYFGRDKDG